MVKHGTTDELIAGSLLELEMCLKNVTPLGGGHGASKLEWASACLTAIAQDRQTDRQTDRQAGRQAGRL